MLDLTEEQRLALQSQKDPVRVRDSQTRRDYVLLRAEVFEHMKRMLETEQVDPSLYEFEEPSQP